MKATFLLLLALLPATRLPAQTPPRPRAAYVGLDIGQTAIAALVPGAFPRNQLFVNIEPNALIPLRKPHRYLRVVLGYTAYESGLMHRNVVLNNRGFYLKAGTEKVIDWISFGWAGTLHAWTSHDRFHFNAPYFGNYEQAVTNGQQLAVGAEGYVSGNTVIGQRWLLRFSPRVNVLLARPPRNGNGPAYIPGIGSLIDGGTRLGGGFQISLFYRPGPLSHLPLPYP